MNALGKILGVRPNEWTRFLVFFSINLLLAIGINIGSTASLSMFIRRYGVEYLPLMFLTTSILTIFVMSIYNNFLGKLSNEKYYLIILGISAVAVAINWWFIRLQFKPIYLVLYPAYSLITALTYSHFFVILYDYFDTLESKRLFPLISAGISLGGILGGFGVKLLLKFLDTQDLLPVWIAFIGLGMAGVAGIHYFKIDRVEAQAKGKKKSSVGFFAGFVLNFKAVMKFPLVRVMIFATVTITIAFFITDFLSNKVFARVFHEEEALTSFLGMFTGVSSFIGLAVQMGALPRLLASLGVANVNFVYPGMTFLSLFSLTFWSASLWPACMGYFNRKFVAYAVGEPVERLIYNSLPSQMRGRTSAFIKGYIVPLSTVAASLLIMAVNLAFGENGKGAFLTLAIVGLAVAAVHLYQKIVIKKGYINSLVDSIKDKNVDLDSFADKWASVDESKLDRIPFDEYLDSDDESLFAMTLEIVAATKTRRATEKLKAIFPNKTAEMKIEALNTLALVEGADQIEFFLEKAHNEEPEVRAAAVKVLGNLKNDDVDDHIVKFLADNEDCVQSAAIVAICSCGDIFKMATGLSLLNHLLISEKEEDFLRGIDVLVSIGDRRFIRTLYGFLEKHHNSSRTHIVNAMAELETGEDDRNLERFHKLLTSEQGKTLGHVIEAIRKIGSPSSIPALGQHFEFMNLTNALKTIAAFGSFGPDATDSLIRILKEPKQSHDARIACLEQLNALPKSKNLDLDDILTHEIVDIYTLIQLRMKIDKEDAHLELLDFIVDEMIGQRITFWIHIVARTCRKPEEVVLLIDSLLGGSKAARAGAIETLENLIDKRYSKLILPVFDSVPEAEKLAAARKHVECPDQPLSELFLWAKTTAGQWHSACMLYSIKSIRREIPDSRLVATLRHGLKSGDIDFIEAALVAAREDELAGPLRAVIKPFLNHHEDRIRLAAEAAIGVRSENEQGAIPMLSTFEKIMFLKKVPTFAGLDSHGLKVLSGISTEVNYSVGEIIFEEGDQGDAMYVIQNGRVRLYKGTNRNNLLVLLEEASYFGDMSVLDNEPRSASAAAETDCCLIRIQRDRFIKLILEYPLISIPIFQVLSRRLRQAQK